MFRWLMENFNKNMDKNFFLIDLVGKAQVGINTSNPKFYLILMVLRIIAQ